jgi:hypothetical protein
MSETEVESDRARCMEGSAGFEGGGSARMEGSVGIRAVKAQNGRRVADEGGGWKERGGAAGGVREAERAGVDAYIVHIISSREVMCLCHCVLKITSPSQVLCNYCTCSCAGFTFFMNSMKGGEVAGDA